MRNISCSFLRGNSAAILRMKFSTSVWSCSSKWWTRSSGKDWLIPTMAAENSAYLLVIWGKSYMNYSQLITNEFILWNFRMFVCCGCKLVDKGVPIKQPIEPLQLLMIPHTCTCKWFIVYVCHLVVSKYSSNECTLLV